MQKFTAQEGVCLNAFTMVFSLTTTFMAAHRVLENWIYWIVIDTVLIFLYAGQGLCLVGINYLVYTIIAIFALFSWYKSYKKTIDLKIAFTGPESSGKSSLSKAIAKKLDAKWFPEYAREYLLERDGKYDFEDIEIIGLEQEKRRNSDDFENFRIYDTEGIVLYIWSIFKYNKCAPSIEELMQNQEYDHYFLCSPKGIPWEDDPLREHPNQREELFEIYLEKMEELGVSFTILEGNFDERVEKAMDVIKGL